jgi:hypothetical protein
MNFRVRTAKNAETIEKKRVVRMVDSSGSEAIEFTLKCLNQTPRGFFGKANVGGGPQQQQIK